MPFEIVRNDIVKMEVDAIVNTANPKPVVGTGVDTAMRASQWQSLMRRVLSAMNSRAEVGCPERLLRAIESFIK